MDRSVLRIRARPSQRWHIDLALYSRASRLRWRRIACVPWRGRTCEREESDCVYCYFQRVPKERKRNGQESGIVVRGGRVTLWRAVEALICESALELVKWWGRHWQSARLGNGHPGDGYVKNGRRATRDRACYLPSLPLFSSSPRPSFSTVYGRSSRSSLPASALLSVCSLHLRRLPFFSATWLS